MLLLLIWNLFVLESHNSCFVFVFVFLGFVLLCRESRVFFSTYFHTPHIIWVYIVYSIGETVSVCRDFFMPYSGATTSTHTCRDLFHLANIDRCFSVADFALNPSGPRSETLVACCLTLCLPVSDLLLHWKSLKKSSSLNFNYTHTHTPYESSASFVSCIRLCLRVK